MKKPEKIRASTGFEPLMGSTRFFSNLTFHMNKTFKAWGKFLQLSYANKAKF